MIIRKFCKQFFIIIVIVINCVCGELSSHLLGQTIHVAYTANLNCNLESCNCGDNDLGGMIQLANTIDALRDSLPDLLLIDSGDFLKTYPLEDANRLMIEMMYTIKFDAIGLGEQEYVDGEDFLMKEIKKYPLSLISTNIRGKEKESNYFQSSRILPVNTLNVGIISIIRPECFDFIRKPEIEILSEDNEIQKFLALYQDKLDLIILLLHGSYREGLKVAEKYPEISIIICGHTQEKYEKKLEHQIVLQSGVDGEFLGFLKIVRDNMKIDFQNRFIPVDDTYGKNSTFQEKVDEYFQKFENNAN